MTNVVKCDGEDSKPIPAVHRSSEVCLAGRGIVPANIRDDSFLPLTLPQGILNIVQLTLTRSDDNRRDMATGVNTGKILQRQAINHPGVKLNRMLVSHHCITYYSGKMNSQP